MGFMISNKEIEVNLDKVKVVLDIQPSKKMRDKQRLNERIVALKSIVSRFAERCLPFFKILKKSEKWNNECQKTFNDLERYFTSLPLLIKPE